MNSGASLREGQALTGPLFNEPMRVESIRANGAERWEADLVGLQSERFHRVTLIAIHAFTPASSNRHSATMRP